MNESCNYHATARGAVGIAGAEVSVENGHRGSVGFVAVLKLEDGHRGLEEGVGEGLRGGPRTAPAGCHAVQPYEAALVGLGLGLGVESARLGQANGAHRPRQWRWPRELHQRCAQFNCTLIHILLPCVDNLYI